MTTPELLRQLQHFPNKRFGQHFLVDDVVLSDIVAAAQLNSEDTVVEIGPGLGTLTKALAKTAKQVLAIEADRELAEYLRGVLPKNVTVITGDALRVDWTVALEGPYKIVANIPYSITSPLLTKIFRLAHKPTEVILLIQKEVAERLVAPAGNNDRGFLTMTREANAAAELVRAMSPNSFYPEPKVESAVIKITPFQTSRSEEIFWPAVTAAFTHKRQTLLNGLNSLPVDREKIAAALQHCGISVMERPSDLSFEQWAKLSAELAKALN